MSTKYRPSNGAEGGAFMAQWCDRCQKGRYPRICVIQGRTLFFEITDPEYPVEWIEDEQGPRCLAFALDVKVRNG